MSVFGELQLRQISLNFKTFCCNLKISGVGVKLSMTFSLFLFCEELWRFKVKESILFVGQNINFTKNENGKSKMQNLREPCASARIRPVN